ncbi:MAG: OmpA family protein [Pirellulales bacterium]|nr:OmpA family protein [Pirellulales bacterium]
MGRVAGAAGAWLALLVVTGCVQTPYAQQGAVNNLQQQQTQLAQQNKTLEDRATALDRDNAELETLLAQSRQQAQLMRDQLSAVKEQLGSVNTQLAQLRDERGVMERRLQDALAAANNSAANPAANSTASMPNGNKPGASIFANSSLSSKLPDFKLAGIESRTDGDVVRIELPADRLFDPQSARLRVDGTPLIDSVVIEVERAYPQQYIALEGHTDNEAPPAGSPNPHELTAARASAVFEYLTQRSRLRPQQLSVVGYGANHPVVSNATPAGRSRNRRIEIVVYPERVGER